MDIFRIFYDPVKVFRKREMGEGINPWIIFAGIILVSVIIYFLSFQHQFPYIMEQISEKLQNLPEEQRQQALQRITKSRMLISGLITVMFMVPLKLLFQSLIFQQAFSIWGNIRSFADSLYVVVYANIISIASQILKLVIEYATGKPFVSFDLSILVGNSQTVIYKVLSNVDIFTIWSLSVMAIGFSEIARVNRTRSFTVVFGLWIVYLVAIWIIFSMGGSGWLRF